MPEQLGKGLFYLFPHTPSVNELVWKLPENNFSRLNELTQVDGDLLELTRKRIALMDIALSDEEITLYAGMGLVAAALDYDSGKEQLSFEHMAEHSMRSWVLIAALQPERDLKAELTEKIQRWAKRLRYRLLTEDAPAKELITIILTDKRFEDFLTFYNERVRWQPYPLIHGRMITYDIFRDLTDGITKDIDTLRCFLDYSLRIAEKETGETIACAVFLAGIFCGRLEKQQQKPIASEIERIISLHQKVQMNADSPNFLVWWERLLDYCALDSSFVKANYTIEIKQK